MSSLVIHSLLKEMLRGKLRDQSSSELEESLQTLTPK
jgi:hypothetical protein